jgi:RNA polymerase sigma-70 factor (ECF subfamily)
MGELCHGNVPPIFGLETDPDFCEEKFEVELELHIRSLLAAADFAAAATAVVQGYGPEVLGFLVALVGNHDEASEALAQASFDLWTGIRSFHQRASMRTWFYTLARHAAARHRRAAHHRPGRHVSVDDVGDLEAPERTETAPYLRSALKNAFAAIRDTLEPDDRALLVLRVDRAMSWNEVARVMADDPDDDSEPARTKRAARLRKRFQLLKDVIRARARAAGLLGDG